ncbi:MAG TPA: serine/threonine-protein kinase [Polyangiaceae bacterium]|nr:serine/threonine-protein kinase [Polyangiaceae bacterium]
MTRAERSTDVESGASPSAEFHREGGGLREVTMTGPTQTGDAGRAGSASSLELYLGATIDGRYLVEKVLGEGGMGVVYRCRHTIIDKLVAMKVLRADMARNQEVTERFLNEARSASSIGNPHIIDISDFGRLPDGATYFIMEYLDGQSLAALMKEHDALPEERILKIAVQLAEGLAAAHDRGIVHRDLKPDNVFVVRRGMQADFVKILDFGIAKVATTNSKLTQAGQVFGTPHYMSPEQAAGSPVDLRSDIYALGVMLYEMTSGQLPFDAENFMAILTQHMYRAPSPFATLNRLPRPISVDLEAVIFKCLAKDPAERYQTMAELANDLHALRTGNRPDAVRSAPEVTPPRSNKRYGLVAALVGVGAAGALWWSANQRAVAIGPDPIAPAPAAANAAPAGQPGPANADPANAAAPADTEGTAAEATLAPAPDSRSVVLAVSPLDAHVFRGETDLGESPLVLEVGAQPLDLELRRAGYQTKRIVLDGTDPKVSVGLEKLPSNTAGRSVAPPAAAAKPASTTASKPAAPATVPSKPTSKPSSSADGIQNPWE